MKTKFFAIAALAATTMFSSCNKDNATFEKEGEATTMKVAINFPGGAQTRATGDPNGTNAEATVNTVDIFIYTASGAYSNHVRLDANKFNQVASSSSSDKYEAKPDTRIATTTGPKTVFAGINLPEALSQELSGKSADELRNAAHSLSLDVLTTDNKFVMFSKAPVNRTFSGDENDAANKVTIECQRLVSKISVGTAPSGLDIAAINKMGTLTSLEFAVDNINKKHFLYQGATPFMDPNWAKGTYSAADFTKAGDADYAAIQGFPAGQTSVNRYATENTSEQKWKEEITRVIIRGQFIPKEVIEGTAGNWTVNSAHGKTNPVTFYAVTPSITEPTAFFFDKNVAIAYAQEKNAGTYLTYTDGKCYWDVFLGKDNEAPNKWDVLRNDFYKCTISKILSLGRETPDITDPKVTPETDTNIVANIEILFWVVKTTDYVLD